MKVLFNPFTGNLDLSEESSISETDPIWTSEKENYVPYTNATKDVDLGTKKLSAGVTTITGDSQQYEGFFYEEPGSLSFTLIKKPVKPSSVSGYSEDGDFYDDGNGNLKNNFDETIGSINYMTGEVSSSRVIYFINYTYFYYVYFGDSLIVNGNAKTAGKITGNELEVAEVKITKEGGYEGSSRINFLSYPWASANRLYFTNSQNQNARVIFLSNKPNVANHMIFQIQAEGGGTGNFRTWGSNFRIGTAGGSSRHLYIGTGYADNMLSQPFTGGNIYIVPSGAGVSVGTTSLNAPSNGMFVAGRFACGVSNNNPTARVDIQENTGYNQLRLRTSYTPTGTNDTNGNTGDIAWDNNYIYVKTSVGWKRAALSTF